MNNEPIISISGLRGIVGKSITAAIAAEYGCAFGTFLKSSAQPSDKLTVTLGRDSRRSSPMLSSAVAAGLCSTGIDIIDLGLVTTPSASLMTRHLNCCGGVMITASHNPSPYNGIKLFLSNGMAPPADKAGRIKDIYLNKNFSLVESDNCGQLTINTTTYDTHISKVLTIVDRDRIATKKFRVVLDSVNGAGGPITKKLLAELGCQTIAINDEPTGLFEHTPEPTKENLESLCEIVQNKQADIGFAQDPDADRLAIIDENGCYIGEEYTLALVTKYILSKNPGPVATNMSTSRMINDIAKQAGCPVIRTPVGEANVADAMLKHNCVIGGEGNGGVIDLRVGPVRDSLVAIALILQLMAESDKKISQLVAELPSYYMIKDKFTVSDNSHIQKIFDKAKQLLSNARLDTSDGYRFDFDNGWVHLRPSNTEPVVRLVIETTDRQTADEYIKTIEQIRSELT